MGPELTGVDVALRVNVGRLVSSRATAVHLKELEDLVYPLRLLLLDFVENVYAVSMAIGCEDLNLNTALV